MLKRLLFVAASALTTLGCVSVDPETDQVLPRGDQRYTFDRVQEKAEDLELGMSKYQVLLLLGSPAEDDDRGNVWVYLPERAAVIIPGRALRLEFRDDRLVDHGYHAIVLGARL